MNINKLVKAVEEKTGEEIILITGYKETQYKGYKIHEANVVVPKYAKYNFGLCEAETYCGYGESIEDCKEQIDDLID